MVCPLQTAAGTGETSIDFAAGRGERRAVALLSVHPSCTFIDAP